MPIEGDDLESKSKPANRWEGTHTYKKPEAIKRKARTVAQLREEAAANSKANREKAINNRRGSIGGGDLASTQLGRRSSLASGIGNLAARRGSVGGNTPGESEIPGADTPPSQIQQNPAMPGSSKKKRNSSGAGPSAGDSEGEGVDPALLKFLTSMKKDLMDSTKEAVGRIESRLERNECSIASLEKRVEQGERVMVDRIAAEVNKQVGRASQPSGGVVVGPGAISKREAAYHLCRRSLKMWPIEGPLLEDGVRQFLKINLRMSDSRINALGSIEVSSLPGRMAKERKEVLATFETREDRDNVKANGVNLAGQKELRMSIYVPGHLMDNLIALNGVGYSIKQRNKNVKRSVKFDEANHDLFLDICIGGTWRRITPVEAKAALKEVPSASSSSGTAISVEELTGLIQGKIVEETNAVVVLDDDEMEA